MKLCDLNPFLRFAAQFNYISCNNPVIVSDCRLFYVLSGKADIYIENQHYSLEPNSLFYCCGGSEYNIISPEGFAPISINFDLNQQNNAYRMPFPPRNLSTDLTDMVILRHAIDDSLLLNSHYYLKDGSHFYRYIEKIHYEFSNTTLFHQEICSSILKELLIELHRFESNMLPPKVDFIIKYIEANYSQNLTNQELANLVGYHEYHLNRLFLTYTGTNLHNYRLKVRLNQARYFIINTNIPLKAIPEKVGFNSYSHFSSYFKQYFGLSPIQFRNGLKDNI